ncbi:hypothetical protein [Amorphus sp. MBR-141]
MTTATTHTIDIPAFIEFCRSKPEGEKYSFGSCTNCALAQFGRSKYPNADIDAGAHGFGDESFECELPVELHDAEKNPVIAEPHTFSALADRLAELGR